MEFILEEGTISSLGSLEPGDLFTTNNDSSKSVYMKTKVEEEEETLAVNAVDMEGGRAGEVRWFCSDEDVQRMIQRNPVYVYRNIS